VAAFVTDTTYTDVDIQILATGGAPRVRVGDTIVGDASCQWPDGGTEDPFDISRHGNTLMVSRGKSAISCGTTGGRHAISLLGPETGQVNVLSLDVQRR
jgi:hypothetical protein